VYRIYRYRFREGFFRELVGPFLDSFQARANRMARSLSTNNSREF